MSNLYERPIKGGALEPVVIANSPESPALADVRLLDENGNPYGVQQIDGKPRVSSVDYLFDIAKGNVAGHEPFAKLGFTPTMTTAISDVWSGTGIYVSPTAAQGMEVVSSNNVDDIGTSIFSGTSTGGSTTTLIDTGKDFTAGTPVAVGDCVILEKSGALPEYGFVTAVAATQLTIAHGFSHGGTGSGRAYTVIDYSATAGAHAIEIDYLDASYVDKTEIVILNGTTEVPTVNLDIYRVQDMHVIATGSNARNTGNIDVRNLADTPIYSRITALYNEARSSIWTVPAGKTLYVVSLTMAFGYAANQTHYCRMWGVSTKDEHGFVNFQPMRIFYPFSEVVEANSSLLVEFRLPQIFPEKTDIRTRGISTFAGVASTVMRGWIE